ncbi:MAG: hypothetical protein JXB13_08215 [Phycisphaerae bacterium]|nr:hypothetical protein [Phycisphaerae bacterium]
MANQRQDWQTEMRQRNELWERQVEQSQQLPEALAVGKVFALTVADGKVLYKVTALRKSQCRVQLVDGGPDHYCDAVLGQGGWFPQRSIEPLVLRHHRLTALFRQR